GAAPRPRTPSAGAAGSGIHLRSRAIERALPRSHAGVEPVERVRLVQRAVRGAGVVQPVQLETAELRPRVGVLRLRVDGLPVEPERLALVPEELLERRLRLEWDDRDRVPIVACAASAGSPVCTASSTFLCAMYGAASE